MHDQDPSVTRCLSMLVLLHSREGQLFPPRSWSPHRGPQRHQRPFRYWLDCLMWPWA